MENLIGFSGREDFTQTELQEVLKRVGLYENIMSLPDKLETVIQPNSYPLTSSQLLALQVASYYHETKNLFGDS